MSHEFFASPVVAVLSTPQPATPSPGNPAALQPQSTGTAQAESRRPNRKAKGEPDPWQYVGPALLILLLLGVLSWLLTRWLRNRSTPPPNQRVIAVRALEKLRKRAMETEPYAFSFEVSDVLRTFVSKGRFHLPATQQTSPEFLAAISSSPMFSEQDRTLLANFLEKCDMIKFARVEATSGDNLALVESALAFVRGGTPA